MHSTQDQRGYILVSMLGPVLGIIAVAAGLVWLVRENWASFPHGMQTGLKLLGIAFAVASFAFSVWRESRSAEQPPRGF